MVLSRDSIFRERDSPRLTVAVEHMGLKTQEDLEAELQNDIKIKVAGVDADGVMRGKVMAKDKFLSAAKSGFGFCRSVGNIDLVDMAV